jgi:hypothetical protein
MTMEIEAKGRDLGFRERSPNEKPGDYLRALQRWDEQRGVGVAYLAEEAAKRRRT